MLTSTDVSVSGTLVFAEPAEFICSLYVGVDVPIPTNPVEVIRIRSLVEPPTVNNISLELVNTILPLSVPDPLNNNPVVLDDAPSKFITTLLEVEVISKSWVGVVVPIPTLPPGTIRIFSVIVAPCPVIKPNAIELLPSSCIPSIAAYLVEAPAAINLIPTLVLIELVAF